jgi:hypothetical protein
MSLSKVYVVEANFQWKEQTGFVYGLFLYGETWTLIDHWREVEICSTRKIAEDIIASKEFMFGDEAVDTRIIERKIARKNITQKGNNFYLNGYASPINCG